jgi:UDP-galactopyranose mutase
MFKNVDLVVVGAGFFGSVVAEQASRDGFQVAVIDSRNHIGGNCYTEFDPETGINVHRYGSHIFHTDNKEIWDYVNQFTEFNNYRHICKTSHQGVVYPMPINLDTINKFTGNEFNPADAARWLEEQKVHYDDPKNFEEQALSLLGSKLYHAFVQGYTQKQWETDPKELPASVAKRLPVYTDYRTDYYPNNNRYQGIPVDGYTPIFEKMLAHDNVTVHLNTCWEDVKHLAREKLVVYTGPIDAFYDYCYGQLNWRTLDFEYRTENTNDYQGVAVLNYPDTDVKWTREVEHRHFHPERRVADGKTVIGREFSRTATQDDVPYYPVKTPEDMEMFAQYRSLTEKEPNVIFGGRLGEYMYYDMHQVIGSALATYRKRVKIELTNRDY